jgi:AAA15 family ATPase/GTPase
MSVTLRPYESKYIANTSKFVGLIKWNTADEFIPAVFDIYSKLMRQYSPIGLKQLNRTGENISSVLFYLKQNNPVILGKILERIKQLPEEEFVSFEFITTSDNSDVLFALKYPNGEIISAKLLSDGTLRALAILTALETVPEGSRIIIEEIDNGVHASRVHVLIDAIWDASVRRNLNTLITTHNPATLDSLNDEQLECVVVCHYDKQSQSAKLTPFFELPRVYELMERGHLGSLVVKNIIEQHLEPDFETKRREDALAWLESLDD